MLNKKGISPVVAIALLLVVSVVAVLGFNNWYQSYSSNLLTNLDNVDSCMITVEGMVGNIIYLKSGCEQNIDVLKLSDSIGNLLCNFEGVSEDALVLWLPFEEVDENNITNDLSGHGNDGYLGNDLFLSSGNGPSGGYVSGFQRVLDLEDYITLGDKLDFENMNEITISGWGYNNNVWSSSYMISSSLYRLGNAGGDYDFKFAGESSGFSTPLGNEWYYLVGVYNGTHMNIYVDGTLIGSEFNDSLLGSDNSGILVGDESHTSNWDGSIDDIKIYRRGLTPDEINRSYINPNMHLSLGINELNLERACNLSKNQKVNIIIQNKNRIFREIEVVS